jgi:hypothetical protein
MSSLKTTNILNPSSTTNNIVLAADGSTTISTLTATTIQGTIKSGTAVASTSGTSIDFTSIPSWVKRVTVMFNGVSTNGTSIPLVQIGAGSIDATSYQASGTGFGSTTMATTDFTTGFGLMDAMSATYAIGGAVVLALLGSNIWVAQGSGRRGTQTGWVCGGVKTLSATLDRVRITTVNGTDTFDAGSINILFEG